MTKNLFKKGAVLLTVLFSSNSAMNAQSLQWADNIGGTSNDVVNEVKTDGSGNVYHVGNFIGTVDFDPGVGVANLVGGTSISGCVSKLTSTGTYVWSKAFLGSGASNVLGVTTDASGNVYVTGLFNGTVDFDPGAASFTMATTSPTDEDVFIVKLTSAGVFAWAKQIGNVGDDGGKSIAVDGTGDIIIAGECKSVAGTIVVDLDPGPAISSFTVYSSDVFLVKLNNAGNYVTGQSFVGAGPDLVARVRVDFATNNVYIGGYFSSGLLGMGSVSDCGYIAKLSSSFVKIWAISFNSGTYTSVEDIQIDGSGNVYSTGYFRGTTDFDPGAGTYLLTSPSTTDLDAFVAKVNSAGAFAWADKIAAGTGNASGTGISLDPLSNVFVTGYFAGTADFNPGAAVFNKYSAGSNDIFVCELDVNGNFANDAQTYGNTGSDIGSSIQCAGTGNYILSGNYSLTVDYNPGTAVTNLTSNGGSDMVIAKYNSCAFLPPLTTALSPTLMTICANSSTVLSVNTNTGVTYNWYNTNAGGSTLGSGTTFTTPVLSTTTSLWVEATSVCAATARVEFSVNTTPSPTVNVTSSSSVICTGNTATLTSTGASTYSWNPGTLTGAVVAVSPTLTTTYSVVGTNTSGCTNSKTITVTVSPCTAIAESQNASTSITIYPNPSNGQFNLTVPETGVYMIINSIGQTVETIEVKEGSQLVYIEGLAEGIYYVIGRSSKAKIVVSK